MPSEPRSPRLAVLIDADNASAKIADGLFEEIAKIGEASVRRIYGDFSSARSKGWAEILSKHAIIPQQQFAYTTGKNASDITLVIDAMDLLHSGRFDGFCLVSSDSDFTRLAARIREQDNLVPGSAIRGGALVIPPFLTGLYGIIHAAIFSFCAGVIPPMPILGRSLRPSNLYESAFTGTRTKRLANAYRFAAAIPRKTMYLSRL